VEGIQFPLIVPDSHPVPTATTATIRVPSPDRYN